MMFLFGAHGVFLVVLLSLSSAASLRGKDPADTAKADGIIYDFQGEKDSRKLITLLDGKFKISTDPKTTKAKGYVCAKGDVTWGKRDDMLREIPSFLQAYHERDKFFEEFGLVQKGITNYGGNGLFHTFTTWFVVRSLRPNVIVESGVGRGFSSWMIAKATEDWAPLFIRMDPQELGWDGLRGNLNSSRQVDLRGKNFKDANEINWDELYQKHGMKKEDKSTTLFVLDDNQDQLDRLSQLKSLGFLHVLVDDNFVPGVGVVFSLKDACDSNGDLRRAFNKSTDPKNPSLPKRCGNGHKECKQLSPSEAQILSLELDSLVDTYWEGPPLAPLDRPYESLKKYIEDKGKAERYEGPAEWTLNHSRLVYESSKAPLYSNLEEASKATGLSEMMLSYESGRYINMVYVKLI